MPEGLIGLHGVGLILRHNLPVVSELYILGQSLEMDLLERIIMRIVTT